MDGLAEIRPGSEHNGIVLTLVSDAFMFRAYKIIRKPLSASSVIDARPSGPIERSCPKLSRRQLRSLDRLQRKRLIPRSEHRGWQIMSSGGIPVWQFITGGRFAPLMQANR